MRICLIILFSLAISFTGYAQHNPFDLEHNLTETERKAQLENEHEDKSSRNPTTENAVASTDTSSQSISSPIIRRDYFKSVRSNQVFHFWYFPMLAIFLALVINIDRGSISKLFKSVANLNYLNLMYRDQRNRYRPQFILFGILALLSVSFFVKQALGYFWDIDMSILKACILIGGIYLIRHLVMQLISFAFPGNSEINQYNYTIFIFNIILGIVFLLINLFLAFSSPAVARMCIYLGTFIFLVMLIYRAIRGILLSSNLIYRNKFRFFMYICTLEIAPIFLIISIFRQF